MRFLSEVLVVLVLQLLVLLGLRVPSLAGEIPLGLLVWGGVLALVIVPGLYLLPWFLRLEKTDWLEKLTLAAVAGMVLQGGWCIAMLHLHGNARMAAIGQLGVGVGLAVIHWIRFRSPLLAAEIWNDLRGWRDRESAWRLLVAVGLVIAAYLLGGYVMYQGDEEFYILRKLYENRSLAIDNIMHKMGEPTTYLYPVWMFTQSVLAHASGADVFVVYYKLWSVTGVLALASQYLLARRLFGTSVIAGAYAIAIMVIALLDPLPWMLLGIFVPLANRHGFTPGVLLPISLALALLLYGTRERKGGVALLVGGAFVLSLVHARDGLHLLMVLGAFLASTLLFGCWDWSRAKRLGVAMAGIMVALGVFHAHHERHVAHTKLVVAEVRSGLREELHRMVRHPARALLVRETRNIVPKSIGGTYRLGYLPTMTSELKDHPVIPLLAVALLAWFAAARERGSWETAFLWSLLATPLLFLNLPILHTAVGYLVGTTDLEILTSLLGQGIALNVLALALIMARFVSLRMRETRWALFVPVGAREWLLLALLLFETFLAAVLFRELVWAPFHGRFHLVLWVVLAIGALLVIRSARRSSAALLVPVSDPAEEHRFSRALGETGLFRSSMVLAGVVIALFALVPHWNDLKSSNLLAKVRAHPTYRQVRFLDYGHQPPWGLPFLKSKLPPSVVEYAKRELPPGRIFTSPPEDAWVLPVFTSHYVSFLGGGLRHLLSTEVEYAKLYRRIGGDPIFSHLEGVGVQEAMLEYLDRFQVEYVLVNPKYEEVVERRFDLANREGRVFRKRVVLDGYTIWEVDRRKLSERLATQASLEPRSRAAVNLLAVGRH